MEKKRIGLNFVDAKKAAKQFLDKSKDLAVQTLDQNDDGKLDFTDVSVFTDSVGDIVKKSTSAVKKNAEESRRQIERKFLQPIFPEDLDTADFFISKLIRITDRNKKYIESEVCQGSVGYLSDKGGLRVVNIFKDSLDSFGLSFYPDIDCEFYYVNPTARDNYISLDDYFSYLKIVRINELQRVAQDLGAKHFRVTYKEECTSFSDVKSKVQIKAAKIAETKAERDISEKKYSMVDVAAEMEMDGHSPKKPTLVYLQKDDNVKNLIHLRMTGGDSFRHHMISIKLSNSSGIKESDAVKIDAVLKAMKVCGNATVANEVKNESRRYLEYEIDF